MTFGREVGRRLLPQLLFFLVIWPLLAIPLAALDMGEQPFTEAVTFQGALTAVAAGTLHMLPEIIALGIGAALTGSLVFALAQTLARCRSNVLILWIEPVAMLLALIAGFSIEFPALLRHPMLGALRGMSVVEAQFVVLAVALLAGVATRTPRAALLHGAAILLLATGAHALAVTPHRTSDHLAPRNSVFLFGLDSLSQSDPLALMRETVASMGGSWYENPVAPGLLTNSTWTAIIQHRTVRETGVFLTFQHPDWDRSPYHLIREAERNGYETWSQFSGQLTIYIGSVAGFDVNRSGPKGWLQIATAGWKDAHVLAPAILPHLPRLPFAKTPPNQVATYGFRLSTELHDYFTSGEGRDRIFAAGHIDYLHQPSYPSMSDLTDVERDRVRRAKVGVIWDLSLHWQYPMLRGEPLGIFRWKIDHLQRLIDSTIRETGAADPMRNNRIVIFSDHGNRKDLKATDFARRRYYKVVLATIGVPPPPETTTPISLLEIPRLVGLPDPTRPGTAPLVVEYTNVEGAEEWGLMLQSSKPLPDGEVQLDPRVTAMFGRRLLAYWPHRGQSGYERVPSVPVELTRKR